MIKVIDNFLEEDQFDHLQSIIFTDGFPWFYNNWQTHLHDGLYVFFHRFYSDPSGPSSSFFEMFDHTLCKLGVKKLYRIKANLNPKTVFHRKSGYHIDYPNITTSILYMNTNNGWTQFKKGKKIKSVANRMVIFDSNLEHKAVTCTDKKLRIVVNFNYQA